jgi:steroid delta-isomerase-like uncharacterized protein
MKTYLCAVPVVVLLCLSFACRDKAAMAELEKVKSLAQTEDQNKTVVRQYFEAVDAQNYSRVKELSTDDFSFQSPGLPEPSGIDMLIQAAKAHYAAFPDWRHKIETLVAEGDNVAVKLIQNGTHKAEYEGIPPTGKVITMPAQCLFVIANGKVREFWAIENYLDFYQQLGMELRPVEAKKK